MVCMKVKFEYACDNKINKELYIAPFTIAIALFCAVGLSISCLLYIVFHSLRHATRTAHPSRLLFNEFKLRLFVVADL